MPAVLIFTGASLILGACGAVSASPAPTPTPSAMQLPPTPTPNTDSWILVDLPTDATQLQHGAEIYRLVCSACHAYSGEGLTDAWRATWAPEDQNCWKSKCHASNHPPDGFELPVAPAVVGREALAPFATAADLHAYIQAVMPWQNPNSLTEEEGWAVTAYIIKLNRMNPGPELNASNAAAFRLRPDSAPPVASNPAVPGSSGPPTAATVAVILLIAGVGVFIAIRRHRNRTPHARS